MAQPVTVNDGLALAVGRRVIARLAPDEALSLAAQLARSAFRRIAFEEGAEKAIFDAAHQKPGTAGG